MLLKSALSTTLLLAMASVASPIGALPPNDESSHVRLTSSIRTAQIHTPFRSVEFINGMVQLPGNPQETTTNVPVADQIVPWTLMKARDGNDLFAIAYADLPLEVLRLGNSAVLNSMRDRLLATDFNWDAIRDQINPISLGDYPGTEYQTIRDGQLTALRLYLVKTDLYALFVQTDDLTQASQFFTSFAPPAVWNPFTSAVGQFTVDLPMAPFVQSETTMFQGEPISWRRYEAHNLYADSDLFVIAHTDLSSTNYADSGTVLSQVAEGVLAEMGIENPPASARIVTLDGNPGIEYAGSTRNGTLVFLRFYKISDRVYAVLGRSQSLESLDQFFSSFQVQ